MSFIRSILEFLIVFVAIINYVFNLIFNLLVVIERPLIISQFKFTFNLLTVKLTLFGV